MTEPLTKSATWTNPVYDGYLADPFVFRHAGVYYAVGTGPLPFELSGFEFPILRSVDHLNWEPLGGALLRTREAGPHHWAPEVAYRDGVFYMYYSVGVSDERHELRVATSDRPQGPYTESCCPVLDPSTASFAIDPSPFQDADGRWYLYYARDFLDSQDGFRPGTGLVVAPLLDMVRIEPAFQVVMRARHDWQMYQAQRSIYGGVYDWHTLEGACVRQHGGRYYCIYSGGNWQNDSYGMDFVVADSPLGPWEDSNDGVAARVLRSIPGRLIGPGHNSITEDLSGRPLLAYHAWNAARTARQLNLSPLSWTADGPRVLSP